jgi:hypothetical protein
MKIIFLKRSPTESDGPKNEKHFFAGTKIPIFQMAEGVGFEPTLGLLLSLISSQVPSTTQPPFLRLNRPAKIRWSA